MAISLEQYVAEATNAFKPARNAVQAQIDAIGGQLQTANEAINRNYAQQQSQLNILQVCQKIPLYSVF